MFRTTDIALIAVMIAAAGATYQVKRDADHTLDDIHRLHTQIRLEQDTINLLKADWSLLTQPRRLQTLVDAYQKSLDLETIQANQIVTVKDIPMRPPVDGAPGQATVAMAKNGRDAIVTGGIKK